MINQNIIKLLDNYYTKKIITYGENYKGVDWNSKYSQEKRFNQFLRLLPKDKKVSILDLGCGYGSLYKYLIERKYLIKYYGIDISQEMIKRAKKLFSKSENCVFETNIDNIKRKVDYCVASGIFNVKFDIAKSEWLKYILKTINTMNKKSKKGVAFNCLTKYSHKSRMENRLFYGDPCFFFDYCKKHFSTNVSLLHDYDLYEFTILFFK